MALAYNEEQRSLIQTARDFAQNSSPVEAFRKVRENGRQNPKGPAYDPQLWSQMVELGWAGMPFPENYGGFQFGVMGLAGCFYELGKTLTASPLLSSVVLSGSTILFAGNEAQKQSLLPKIIGGETLFALAVDEGPHHAFPNVATTAKASGGNYVLNGVKTLVMDGHSAQQLIVAARSSGSADSRQGISLFLVEATAKGVQIERTGLLDSRSYARVTLKEVSVSAEQVLGKVDEGFAGLDKALDHARICLAAEMLGGMEEIFQRTVKYLKERKQFGELIGSFQGLQHRAAHMYTQIEMCRSALMAALDAIESDKPGVAALVSGAKALANDSYELVSNEAVQMHGGIGVTDELDIGLFLKRARVSAALLGSARFHYDRYATLNGY